VNKVLSSRELNKLLFVARSDFTDDYPLILLLADTGCRIGEALALRWSDVDLAEGTIWIRRSVDHTGRFGPTKTGRERRVDLSARLAAELEQTRPDVFGPEAAVFASRSGGVRNSANFRTRVFKRPRHGPPAGP
jgi:integrase